MFSVPNVLFMGLFVKATRRSQNVPYQGSRFGINLLSKVKACSGATRQVADFIMVCLTSLDPSLYPSLEGIVFYWQRGVPHSLVQVSAWVWPSRIDSVLYLDISITLLGPEFGCFGVGSAIDDASSRDIGSCT